MLLHVGCRGGAVGVVLNGEPMQFDFTAKTAIVTGASSGIGAACARLLVGAGATVVAVGRSVTRLDELQSAPTGSAGSVHPVVGDLTDDTTIERVVRAALDTSGTVDVLVHGAGLLEKGTLQETDTATVDRMWNVNARAPMLLTKAAVPHLAPGSSIVFVSSTVAHVGFPAYAPYSAAKGAVEAFARAVAVELAPATRVNVVAPGFATTPMLTDQYPQNPSMEEWIHSLTPLGFIGSAEDVACSILMLASPQASRYVTGATLVCDGGWVAKG
ncbi:MAG: SDR family NAD(P)-dependent oxidoreductase [Acidimicrobiales bacterium]